MTRQSAIEVYVLATVLPFLLWAALAMAARKNTQLLGQIYPLLRALSYGTWALPLLIGLVKLFSAISQHQLLVFFFASIPFNGGIQLARSWVQSRVEPDAIPRPSSDGWWPAKRDF
jgi:hypothetical protein